MSELKLMQQSQAKELIGLMCLGFYSREEQEGKNFDSLNIQRSLKCMV